MALFIRQDDNRSQLQQRLATELQEKARKRAEEAELPDHVEDSQFIKGTTGTARYAWIWIVAVVALIVAAIIIFIVTAE